MTQINENKHNYNKEFLNNATFQYYKEIVENHIYSLYQKSDQRLVHMTINQLQ